MVNADDFGFTPDVNEGIVEAHRHGILTATTLMANGAAVENAALRAKELTHCSFGVHLNATEFHPLTTQGGLQPILDKDGCFNGNAIRKVAITGELQAAIFAEWSAQVERAQAAGFRVSHFDSHHHVHTVPGLFPVLKRLQRQFAIRKVRATMNIYCARVPARPALLAQKAVWNFALRNYYRTITTDGFTSLQIFTEAARERKLSHQSVELMVHPGGESYTGETKMLAGEWWRSLPVAIEPISYNEL